MAPLLRWIFVSPPSPAADSDFWCILVRMSDLNPNNGFIFGALKNIFIAKMLIGVMFFLWSNFAGKNSSKSNIEISLLQPSWLKMVKKITRFTKYSGTPLQGTRQEGKSAYKGNDLRSP